MGNIFEESQAIPFLPDIQTRPFKKTVASPLTKFFIIFF
tara:strand:- start:907 stop:1023 length:117 start_codon:yes stop_codon:yes gene_type:complete